jgi:hypothetical protein
MIHGTAAHGIGTHGRTIIGDITDGTTHGTTEVFMTHGIMVDITVTCTTITTDGTADGTLTGTTIITITTLAHRCTTKTAGMEAADSLDQTEYSPAGYPHEAAQPAQAV